MDTILINNNVDKTEIIAETKNGTEKKTVPNNCINGWVVGEKLNEISSEADLFYVTNDNGEKGLLKLFKKEHCINLDVYKKLKSLKNRHVMKILDYGMKDKRQYVIEEFIEGNSLDKVELPLGRREIWKLIYEVNKGLRGMHNCGVVHRDIKPSNILLSKAGHFIITDFGISSFVKDRLEDYSHTAGYSAPELFVNDFTSAYDYYGFGFVLLYGATGINPFSGRGKNYIYRDEIENFTVKDISTRKEVLALPERFQNLVLGLINKDCEFRCGYNDVFKWLCHLPVKKKHWETCQLAFNYSVRSKKDFIDALYNSPEVMLEPLKQEQISLLDFLSSINKYKARRLFSSIQKLKVRSQKKYFHWTYDPYFDYRIICLVKKYFHKKELTP